MNAAYPERYEIDSIRWLDEEDGEVSEFEQGRMYTAEITVSAVEHDGVDRGCVFADAVTAYIDGKEVTGWNNPVTVNDDNTTVTIRYQFRKGASAPEVEIYVFISQPQSAMLTVGEWHNASWETSFTPTCFNIEYWDGEIWDQWDCLNDPEAPEGDYDFGNDVAETVRFRIVAYMGNTAVATSNEFTITWKEPVSFTWNGNTCTVALHQQEMHDRILAAAYEDGRLTGAAFINAENSYTANLNGDEVKVFFLNNTYKPECDALLSVKP